MTIGTTLTSLVWAAGGIDLIPEKLCQDEGIGRDRVFIVLLFIAEHTDRKDVFAYSVRGLTDSVRLHGRDVTKALRILARADLLITLPSRRGRTAKRLVHLPEVSGEVSGEVLGDPPPIPVPVLVPVPPLTPQRTRRPPAAVKAGEEEPTADTNRGGWPTDQDEARTIRALTALVAERHLPLHADELLTVAYETGMGLPWIGYLHWVKPKTEHTLNGSRDPAAVIRARLDPAADVNQLRECLRHADDEHDRRRRTANIPDIYRDGVRVPDIFKDVNSS